MGFNFEKQINNIFLKMVCNVIKASYICPRFWKHTKQKLQFRFLKIQDNEQKNISAF